MLNNPHNIDFISPLCIIRIVQMDRGQYGTLDLSTGEWDGAMREIIDGVRHKDGYASPMPSANPCYPTKEKLFAKIFSN